LITDFSSNEGKRALPVEHEESRQDQPPAEQQGSIFSILYPSLRVVKKEREEEKSKGKLKTSQVVK
jgi:hypothetical protein